MRCLCLLLCVLALFSSCKESEKDKIARLVEEWEGKEILFPARSFFTIQGKDTVDFSFVDADYKVVTYIRFSGMYQLQVTIASLEAVYAGSGFNAEPSYSLCILFSSVKT